MQRETISGRCAAVVETMDVFTKFTEVEIIEVEIFQTRADGLPPDLKRITLVLMNHFKPKHMRQQDPKTDFPFNLCLATVSLYF